MCVCVCVCDVHLLAYLVHLPHVLHITSASAWMIVVVFYEAIISDATKEFLPGESKELLN